MSKKLPSGITRTYLEQVPLPNHGGRYTPISHKSIIDNSLSEILSRNLTIQNELYSATYNGNVANGKIIMSDTTDNELQMMFMWGNSYDKSTRFKCGIGAYVKQTQCYMFAGNLSNYSRKHTGTADQEAMDMIQDQLSQANAYYNVLCKTKDIMKTRTITLRQMAEILGVLYVEKGYINKEQMSMIGDHLRNEVKMFEDLSFDNLWNFYNIVAYAIKDGHPKNWFENQAGICSFFNQEILNNTIITPIVSVSNPVIDENFNQLSLFDDLPADLVKEKVNVAAFEQFDSSPFELPDL